MAAAPALTAAQQQQQLVNNNLAIRGAILSTSVAMTQQIYSVGQIPAQNNVFNVPVNNVGLIRGFYVKIQAQITNTAAAALALTNFGASNLISQVVFTDLNNTVRVQTAGWHLFMIDSAKQPLVMGGAYAPNVPVGFGNNYTVQSAPSSIAASGIANLTMYYYVPLAYAANDLRGSMYAGVVNATSSLQITLNPTPCVAAGADPTLAIYSGNNAGGYTAGQNVTVTVWQDYLDQLPTDQNGNALLPQLDTATIYELKNVAFGSPVVGQDFAIPYANFRTFMSTSVIFDNGGTLNAGTDVNYFNLTAANTTSIFKYGPNEASLLARTVFMADPPAGSYFFSHASRPINTQQFGNMALLFNAKTVNANAALLVGFEDFATVSQVQYVSTLQS